MRTISRRKMIKQSVAYAAGISLLPSYRTYPYQGEGEWAPKRFDIGICDWSIGKRADSTALEIADKLGINGVQVSIINGENEQHLAQKRGIRIYSKAEKITHRSVGSLAIGKLNQVPFKSEPQTIEWVSNAIDTAKKLTVKVILLAFFGKGDLKGDSRGTEEVIRRLKLLAPKAEKKGVILGIESWLSAEEHMYIIDAVGSSNVKVYYDVANSHKMGYNIYEEIRWLGKKGQICEFHMKENGYLLGQGEIDFVEVRKAIDDIEYAGWIVIEGARPEGMDLMECYQKNVTYIQKIFND